MTQQEMLDAQWQEDTGLFGFTDSDWYKDAKEILSFGWMLNNADKLQGANQDQASLMYAVPKEAQPNAQYIDPRYTTTVQAGGMDNRVLIYGGLAVLAYLVLK